jgi:beta-lactamase regulating signal transducer with metallopeptidase domain
MIELIAVLAAAAFTSSLAIASVLLLRGLLRQAFSATVSYAAWFAVPVVMVITVIPTPHVGVGSVVADNPVLDYVVQLFARLLVSSLALNAVFWLWSGGFLIAAALLVFNQLRFIRSLGTVVVRDGLAYSEYPAVSPVVMGLVRPTVVVPSDFRSRYTAQEQALILAHEHTHVRRGDLIANLLCSVIRCVLWFNPLTHLGAGRFRFDQELACDATTLRGRARLRKTYATAILKTLALQSHLPIGSPWKNAEPLYTRIAHLRRPAMSGSRRTCGYALVGILLTGLGGAAWSLQPAAILGGGANGALWLAAARHSATTAACPLAAKRTAAVVPALQRR